MKRCEENFRARITRLRVWYISNTALNSNLIEKGVFFRFWRRRFTYTPSIMNWDDFQAVYANRREQTLGAYSTRGDKRTVVRGNLCTESARVYIHPQVRKKRGKQPQQQIVKVVMSPGAAAAVALVERVFLEKTKRERERERTHSWAVLTGNSLRDPNSDLIDV